jgi:hypothetical protein
MSELACEHVPCETCELDPCPLDVEFANDMSSWAQEMFPGLKKRDAESKLCAVIKLSLRR